MLEAAVAWAVSELAAHDACRDVFAQSIVIRLLSWHLAFETIPEHSKYAVVNKANASNALDLIDDDEEDDHITQFPHPSGNGLAYQMHNVVTATMAMKDQMKKRQTNFGESEDHATKAYMKAMAAKALWKLAKGNARICRLISHSRALLCFAVLLLKGPEEVRYNSAMALMEITAIAEHNADLRRSTFKPTALSYEAVIDQILRIIECIDSELLVPCIKTIGNLARTIRSTETRMITPLVKRLDHGEAEVTKEACVSLMKFACSDNYLHSAHSKAIIGAGGAMQLVQLVYFGEEMVQPQALVLLCYIALHVPDSEVLAKAQVLKVLEWASKPGNLAQELSDETFSWEEETLLARAKRKLELHLTRGRAKRFH